MHKKKVGTPTMGGVIIWLTVVVLAFLFWSFSQFYPNAIISKLNFLSRSQTWVPLAALIVSAIFGFTDDLFGILRIGPGGGGLRMRDRMIMYALVGAGGAWWFYYKLGFNSINIPFLGDWVVGLWYIPFFIFVIIASAFSANETDGLDGLSSGVFLTMFAAYAVIAFDQGRMDLVVFLSALMGSLIAFLWFNIYPARFFMGDTGSMSLGVVLGVVAMLTNTPFLLLPIALIFIMESGSVIIQLASKKLRGKKIFLSTPIHHHFEALGWHETQVTMRFWMISAVGAIIGLILFLVDSKIPPLFK
jgi:phospho-N-acetylmuramoyl-pentapeptide-transferase